MDPGKGIPEQEIGKTSGALVRCLGKVGYSQSRYGS
jgi:hypothetical protein